MILRIKATLGEVNSEQLRRIADVAKKYGRGFVHFVVRGSPEIPEVKEEDLGEIKKELEEVNLEILDKGIENIQSCFGGYCTEGIIDVHPLLKRIDKLVEEMNFNDPRIKISGAGCINSCGISYLNDIGFFGQVEPKFDLEKCKGCGICVEVCKEKALKLEKGKAIQDRNKCKYCGKCIRSCPFDAIYEGKKGLAVLLGGRDSPVEETVLAEIVADFVSEDEAFEITEKMLKILKENPGQDVRGLIEKYGVKKLK